MNRTDNQHHLFMESYSLAENTFFSPDDFGDEEELIAKTTEQFVRQDLIPKWQLIEQHDYNIARSLFKKLGDLGLLGVDIPEEYGGFALGKKVSGLVAEKMGYGGSFSVSFNIHVGVGMLPYVYFGTEAQKQYYLPRLVSGEWVAGYALTEPSAGSDALQSKTNARLSEDGATWVLNGEKQWITNAKIANVYVVFAKTSEGMTAFIVERTVKGVSVGPEEKKMGIKGSSTATLILEDVVIPADCVLGEIGKGHHVALNILNLARLKLAFANIGTSKHALQLSISYGSERKQFGKSILEFSMIQEKIANMATAIFGSESAAYRTAGLLDDIMDSPKASIYEISKYAVECAINKVLSSESLASIVDEAVQIHGGYGYMQEYEVERLYRDARINRIFEGTNEINRLTITKNLLKRFPQEIEGSLQAGSDRNQQYIHYAKCLFHMGLKAFSKYSVGPLDQEQEFLRLFADSMRDIYMMESIYMRTVVAKGKKDQVNESIHVLMTDVLCEEGYRQVESAIISVLSNLELNEKKRKEILSEIRDFQIPIYADSILKKRKIAKAIIKRGKYEL